MSCLSQNVVDCAHANIQAIHSPLACVSTGSKYVCACHDAGVHRGASVFDQARGLVCMPSCFGTLHRYHHAPKPTSVCRRCRLVRGVVLYMFGFWRRAKPKSLELRFAALSLWHGLMPSTHVETESRRNRQQLSTLYSQFGLRCEGIGGTWCKARSVALPNLITATGCKMTPSGPASNLPDT